VRGVRGDGDRQDARGLHFAHAGKGAEGTPGIFFDMNARGDSQQHREYAERLYEWKLKRWTHTVTPMTEPHPPADQMDARYCDACRGSANSATIRFRRPTGASNSTGTGRPSTNHALYTVRPFVYFHLGGGCRRIVGRRIEPMDVPGDYIQPFLFDELYRKTHPP